MRLQPQTVQNVVTYSTVIDVPNPNLQLKPGMTANVTIEVARRDAVLRVPNAALRFRPLDEAFTALGQARPAAAGRDRAREAPPASVALAVDGEKKVRRRLTPCSGRCRHPRASDRFGCTRTAP